MRATATAPAAACSDDTARVAQRGKGTFYCGVGLLVFFIGTGDGGWGLNHVAALLLAHGADVHKAGDSGTTPMTLAVHHKNKKIIEMLKQAGG